MNRRKILRIKDLERLIVNNKNKFDEDLEARKISHNKRLKLLEQEISNLRKEQSNSNQSSAFLTQNPSIEKIDELEKKILFYIEAVDNATKKCKELENKINELENEKLQSSSEKSKLLDENKLSNKIITDLEVKLSNLERDNTLFLKERIKYEEENNRFDIENQKFRLIINDLNKNIDKSKNLDHTVYETMIHENKSNEILDTSDKNNNQEKPLSESIKQIASKDVQVEIKNLSETNNYNKELDNKISIKEKFIDEINKLPFTETINNKNQEIKENNSNEDKKRESLEIKKDDIANKIEVKPQEIIRKETFINNKQEINTEDFASKKFVKHEDYEHNTNAKFHTEDNKFDSKLNVISQSQNYKLEDIINDNYMPKNSNVKDQNYKETNGWNNKDKNDFIIIQTKDSIKEIEEETINYKENGKISKIEDAKIVTNVFNIKPFEVIDAENTDLRKDEANIDKNSKEQLIMIEENLKIESRKENYSYHSKNSNKICQEVYEKNFEKEINLIKQSNQEFEKKKNDIEYKYSDFIVDSNDLLFPKNK